MNGPARPGKCHTLTENLRLRRQLHRFYASFGHGCFNYLVIFTSGLVMLHVMLECIGVGYITNAAACELNLTAKEIGLLNSAAFFGVISTAIFWGSLGDLFGRRRVMLPAIIASCAASFGSSMATDFHTFISLRLITGCLVSASSATIFAYLGEMHTTARRDGAIMWASTAIAFSFVILPILGWLILTGSWSFRFLHLNVMPWRVFIWSWGFVGMTAAIILIFLPESPRYLLVAKGRDKAKSVLAKIYACNKRKKKEDYPVGTIVGVTEMATKHGFKVAFRNLALFVVFPLRRCVLISHFCMFMIFMPTSGISTWLPDILHEMFTHVNSKVSMCDVMVAKYGNKTIVRSLSALSSDEGCHTKSIHVMVYPTSVMLGVVSIIMYVVTGYVVAKYSKITYFCTSLAACSLMLAIAGILSYPPIAIALMTIGLSSGTTASLLAAIAVQVFPTSIRALALCTMYMCGRLGAAVGANLFGLAVQHHCEIIYLFVSIGTALSVLLMILWPNVEMVRSKMESHGYIY